MKRFHFILALCICSCAVHLRAQDTLSRTQLIGNWNAYMIMDTTAYFATPDSLKIADSLGIDILHFKMITYHFQNDGSVYVTSEYMDDSMDAEWILSGDTIAFREEGDVEFTAAYVTVVGEGRVQLCNKEVVARKTETRYVYMEKVK